MAVTADTELNTPIMRGFRNQMHGVGQGDDEFAERHQERSPEQPQKGVDVWGYRDG
jgi:hypothetical protein